MSTRMATDPASLQITEEQYERLPEEVARSIEVVNGMVIFCESPSGPAEGSLHLVMAEGRINSVEEYRLDRSQRNYQLAMVHREALSAALPGNMQIDVAFTELEES
ncbi:hypothetical protein GCM10022221_78500 [Actinocorallia aurea]